MDTRNKAEKFWDRTASFYDREEIKDEMAYLNLIEKARKYLKVNDIVLDFGCGTGLVCNEIADNVKRVYAIDISSKMIEIARNKAFECKIKNIDFAYTTIFDERYKRDSIDIIIVFNVLHLLDDTQKVVQRISELLKPGGFIISATPCMGEKTLLNSLLKIGSILGIIPKIKSFKNSELERIFINENMEVTENIPLKLNSTQYLLIAQKQ
jgi:2-polyprenyl-3-methyl-5-hydroxy-6-metoxy-1,4-benzoquinol methylase